jgi:hypothetical protein
LGQVWGEGTEAVFEATFEEDEHGHMRRRLSLDNHLAILDTMGGQDYDRAFRALRCPVLFVPCYAVPSDLSPEELMGENMRRATIEHALEVLPHAAVWAFQPAIHDLPQQHPEELAELIAQMARGELPQAPSAPPAS